MKKEVFEKAKDDLIRQINNLGFHVAFLGQNHKRGGGSMDDGLKIVTVYYPATRKRTIFVLAHELRHVQHLRLMLYPSYYNPEVYQYAMDLWQVESPMDVFSIKRPDLPNLGVALRAENNCNRFAEKYLNALGVIHKAPKYPKDKTVTYRIWKTEHRLGLRQSI